MSIIYLQSNWLNIGGYPWNICHLHWIKKYFHCIHTPNNQHGLKIRKSWDQVDDGVIKSYQTKIGKSSKWSRVNRWIDNDEINTK